MLLSEFAGLRNKSGAVGLELEVEAAGVLPEVVNGWNSKPDNSLRGNSLEYTSRTPFTLNNLSERVNTLVNAIKDSKPNFSSRTSLHVHVNCLSTEVLDVWTGLFYSILLEPSLLSACAPHRRSNKFCTPFNYSYAQEIEKKVNSISMNFNPDVFKYTAVAPHVLTSFGSIEFRMKEGLDNPKEIVYWSTLCHQSVHKPASVWKSPLEMFEHFIDTDCSDLLSFVDHDNRLQLNQDATYANLLMLAEVALDTDWDTWKIPTKPSKTAAPQVNQWIDENLNAANAPQPAGLRLR